jgi:hypothetical protein
MKKNVENVHPHLLVKRKSILNEKAVLKLSKTYHNQ